MLLYPRVVLREAFLLCGKALYSRVASYLMMFLCLLSILSAHNLRSRGLLSMSMVLARGKIVRRSPHGYMMSTSLMDKIGFFLEISTICGLLITVTNRVVT